MSNGLINMRLGGDVFKRSMAQIVVENVLRPRQSARAAHDRYSFPHASGSFSRRGGIGEIEINVIGDHQVEETVAVIIHESAPSAPSFARTCHSRLLCDFGKYSRLVMVQTIFAEVGDIQIFPAIVVVIADTSTLSPASRD